MEGTAGEILAQYGALGVMAMILGVAVRVLFKQVQTDKERETARADRLEVALEDLNKAVQEKVIPAALDMVATNRRLIELLAQEQDRRRSS